jgi:hypothetical protein
MGGGQGFAPQSQSAAGLEGIRLRRGQRLGQDRRGNLFRRSRRLADADAERPEATGPELFQIKRPLETFARAGPGMEAADAYAAPSFDPSTVRNGSQKACMHFGTWGSQVRPILSRNRQLSPQLPGFPLFQNFSPEIARRELVRSSAVKFQAPACQYKRGWLFVS